VNKLATEQAEEVGKAEGEALKAFGMYRERLVFTNKYFKIVRGDGFYELNHDQVERVKNLGGFYWDKVKSWVIKNQLA
jgi:hypothetical protein